jgi:prepilin-type N-terminal cleavage/methylation domain-containing protein
MKGRRGFTLVETLLAVSVTGICVALFLPFLGSQRKIWEKDTALCEEAETLASALQWITRGLQSAGYGWQGSPLVEIGDERISYIAAAEDPARHADSREGMRLVSVYAAAGDLFCRVRRWDGLRGEWDRGSSHKLASKLERIHFSALAGDGGPASASGEVTAVEVVLEGRRSRTHRGFVSLRNAAMRHTGGAE